MSDPVADGREALHSRTGYPWYDAKADGVRRIELRQEEPPPPPKAGSEISTDWIGAVLQFGAWTVLVIVLAGIVVLLVRAWSRRERRGKADDEEAAGGADRVQALPFPAAARSNLLAEAERSYRQGNYRRAIVFLFSHQLVELDKHQRIRLERGKTNRQYLREIRPVPALHGLVEQTMIVFERVFFGHRPLDRQTFETCWSRLDEFHRLAEGGIA
jgi:hypothetical protein